MKPHEMFDDAPVSSFELPQLAKRYTDHIWIDPRWKQKLWGIVAAHKQSGGTRCNLRTLVETALSEMYGPLKESGED